MHNNLSDTKLVELISSIDNMNEESLRSFARKLAYRVFELSPYIF